MLQRRNTTCAKRYPKQPVSHSTIDSLGFPAYARTERDCDIVSYNALLLLLFNAHINAEICAMANIISYVYSLVL